MEHSREMNIFKEQKEQEGEEMSPKRMYRELAKIFHPDMKGAEELMKKLNLAEEESQKDNPEPLKALYYEWFPKDKKRKVDLYV